MKPIIKIDNLSKQYRLGVIGTGTLSNDLKRWWYNVRGKEDPFLKVGEVNDRAHKGSSEYVWALKDINMEIMPGEVVGIIGKNGAGKSTLLKILSKVTGPTTGSINYDGRIGSLLEVGTGFHPELTGRENIFLNGAILGMTKQEIRSKLDEIVDFSGVERYIDTPVKRYSSGMKVRLGFAVAAHLEPEILVVDEVLAVGDAEFQKKAIGKMQQISEGEGRTVLFVSHNMASVQNLCSRAVLIQDGQIGFSGGVDDTIDRYLLSKRTDLDRNISERKDRQGLGQVQAVETWLENSKGAKVLKTQTGSDITIALRIKQTGDQPVKGNLIVSFALNTFNNIQISDISNRYTGDDLYLERNEKEKIIKVKLPKFPLNEGIYYYNIFISVDGIKQDWIREANIIEVEKGDYYGSGKIAENKRLMMLDNKWIY